MRKYDSGEPQLARMLGGRTPAKETDGQMVLTWGPWLGPHLCECLYCAAGKLWVPLAFGCGTDPCPAVDISR